MQKSKSIISTCLALIACLSVLAQAATCDPQYSPEQLTVRGNLLKKMLTDKRFSVLENEVQGAQSRVENDGYNDEILRLDIYAAFDAAPSLEPLLTEWIKAYPRSYAARISRARYYIAVGGAKRGMEFAASTSTEQMRAMRLEFEKASADLDVADTLSATPSVAYAQRIHVGRALVTPAEVMKMLVEGQRRFPDSLAVKSFTIATLNPKWDGSMEALDGFLAAQTKSKLDAAKLNYLKYRVETEKADYFRIVKDKGHAIDHYVKAGEICSSVAAWRNVTLLARESEDWENYMLAINRQMALFPNNKLMLQNRGWGYEKLGRLPEAVADYEEAARLGSAWAQSKLGWMLSQGIGAPPDLHRAVELLEKAEAAGDPAATARLLQVRNALNEL